MKAQHILIVLLSLALSVNAQTQIGNDIDGFMPGDGFGIGVSISADGTVVAASAYGTPNEEGRLRVFRNIGGVWTLYGTDINGENFGGIISYSVSLSSDGTTLAVSTFDNVKVFNYDTNTEIWSQKGNDIPNNTAFSQFGYSIKLSSDGNTIAIGSLDSPIVPSLGVTQVFHFDTGSWNQVNNDINGLVSAEHSGRSVDMSSNGNFIAISNDNSIRVYENSSDTWTLLGDEILATGNQYANRRISLSSDGSILAIGEPDFTDSFIQRGRVRVFSYDLGTWNQIGNTILGEVAYYRTGTSVSLSSDGQILAIGEPGSTSGSTDMGRTRLFQNQNGSWIQIGNDIFGEASLDYSGGRISLSSDASTLIIGAPLNDGNGTDSGHVRVYDLSNLLSVNAIEQHSVSVFPNPAKSHFTIQLGDNNGLELDNINIYNSLGQLVKSVTINIVNTSKLSSGIYYVEIVTNKGKTTKKIVIL